MLRSEKVQHFARDCIYFKGDKPCQPHLRQGVTCRCELYAPRTRKALIIQLSDPAEVVRSLALAERLKGDDPKCQLLYLTDFPELLDANIDEVLSYDTGNLLRLQMDQLDVIYNLDMDSRACSVTNILSAEVKKGFYLRQGACCPLDEDSNQFYINRLEPKSEEAQTPRSRVGDLFSLCGIEYRREMPRLQAVTSKESGNDYEGRVVGICPQAESQSASDWEVMRWVKLVDLITEQGWVTVLLGDERVESLNQQIAEQSQAETQGAMTLSDYKTTISRCDVVVGREGVANELAWALGREVVLLHDGREARPNLDGIVTRSSVVVSDADKGICDILPDKVVVAISERLGHRQQLQSQSQNEPEWDELFSRDKIRALIAENRGRPV